jgi:hypothetical protein
VIIIVYLTGFDKMKKMVIVLLLFFSLSTLYSIDNKKNIAGISLGVLGVGLNSDQGISGGYVYGQIFNFIYQSKIGLGLNVSPLFFYMGINNENYSSITFINVSVFYNFFKPKSENFSLGPFVSLNAIKYMQPENFELRLGFSFSLLRFDSFGIFSQNLFIIESGYKYNRINNHAFYVQAGMDLAFVLAFFSALGADDVRGYYEKNPSY